MKKETRTGFVGSLGTAFGIPGAVLLVFLSAPLLASCGNGGFKPVYGSLGASEGSVENRMREINIAPIPGRVGQRIRNELLFGTTGGGEASAPKMRLEIAVRQTISTTLVNRVGDSKSQVYNIDASFKLINIKEKKVVLEGKSYSRAGFERFNSIFSNVRARKDAEDRAAKSVATDLKARLSAYLSSTS